MATIRLNLSTNLTDASVWYGQLTGYNANSIVIQNGPFTDGLSR